MTNDKIMNGDIQTQAQSIDRFKLGRKWFWIGIVVATLNSVAGLIYGMVLLLEKNHRKEGVIIAVWAIIWALIGYFIIGPWLIKSGYLPKFQIIREL